MTNKINTASIAFDIDGVFADTMTLFLDIARDEYDLKNFQYNDITSYNLEECLNIDRKVVESIITNLLDGNHTSPFKTGGGIPRGFNQTRQEADRAGLCSCHSLCDCPAISGTYLRLDTEFSAL